MDNTQVVLIGAGVALFVLAVTLAGWRHRLFLAAVFGSAIVLVAVGIAWPRIRDNEPKLAEHIDTAAASQFLYFGILAIALALAVHAQWRARRPGAGRERPPEEPPAPVAPREAGSIAEAIARRAPSPSPPPPDLNELERAPCLLALDEAQALADDKVSLIVRELLPAGGDAAEVKALASGIRPKVTKSQVFHANGKTLARESEKELRRLGIDLKPVCDALRDLLAPLRGLEAAKDYPPGPLLEAAKPVIRANDILAKAAAELRMKLGQVRRAHFDD